MTPTSRAPDTTRGTQRSRRVARRRLGAFLRALARRKLTASVGAVTLVLVLGLVAAVWTSSWWVGVAISGLAAAVLGAIAAWLRAQLRARARARVQERKRRRQKRIRQREERLDGLAEKARIAAEPAQVPQQDAPQVVRRLLRTQDVLAAAEIILAAEGAGLNHAALRVVGRGLNRRGYLRRSLEVLALAADDAACTGDAAGVRGELALLEGTCRPTVAARASYTPVAGRILHVVGTSLPDKQTGYTVRTHNTVVAQRESGLDPVVVTPPGFPGERSDAAVTAVDGISYHRLPGPSRLVTPRDEWFGVYVRELAQLVRRVRPSVLHAASDFINADAARLVGDAFGVPVVYESRGFWEESWLSRVLDEYGWDLTQIERRFGMPDQYVLRRSAEDRARAASDAVVTLAPVMADRIVAGGVTDDRVVVAPNAVDAEAFPMVTRNPELAGRLGLAPETIVIGYISSLVEYEGIDLLLHAYARLQERIDAPTALVLVGDGPKRTALEELASTLGLEGSAIFTGQVPHADVLDYYGVIDVFVVPRKPVTVCQLVTPLKPYEALATGRALVMSDVPALRGIADECGAATFVAGDPEDLVRVLAELVGDPQRRRQMGADGSQWVRARHTWGHNAGVYLELYRQLGAVGSDVVALGAADAGDLDLEELRRRARAQAELPYEILDSSDRSDAAERIMSPGWTRAPFEPQMLDERTDWAALSGRDRSWEYQLHAWEFLGPVLVAHQHTQDPRYLDWAMTAVVSWGSAFAHGTGAPSMAWYDMSLGLRGHRLAYVVEQALRGDVPDVVARALLRVVVRHQREFLRPAAFNPASNHGYYVAVGQAAFARRLAFVPHMDAVAAQARERLSRIVQRQFAADGGHLEHSPDYHRMLLGSFDGAIEAGLIESSQLVARLDAAHDVLGWFVQPDGTLVQFGDSPKRVMTARSSTSRSATTSFHVTRGRSGTPDDRTLHVLPESGYAIVRDPQPRATDDHEQASYLALAAGFHSRVHKHADTLTLVWFDRAQEILVDAGRYGYGEQLPAESPLRDDGFYYVAPERQYVESTRAHNTVAMDGRDHPRAGVKPFGSALRQAEHLDGWYRIVASADHGRFRHEREVIFRPGESLLITDAVGASDEEPHGFTSWLNLPEDLDVTLADGHLVVEGPWDRALHIVALDDSSPVAPVKGGTDPLRGWRSRQDRELTPAYSTGFHVVGRASHVFRTLLAFSEDELLTEPAHPFGPTTAIG